MTRIQVSLKDVTCYDTEDVTGADEFYLTGAVSNGIETSPVLTVPVSINDKETKPFQQGGGLVFDKDLSENSDLKIALIAFDEDAEKDWTKYGDFVTKIGSSVSQGLKTIPRPETAIAGAIIPYVISGVGIIMKLDKDDQLGQYTYNVNVGALANGENRQIWTFQGGSGWYSSWKYQVRYTITKG